MTHFEVAGHKPDHISRCLRGRRVFPALLSFPLIRLTHGRVEIVICENHLALLVRNSPKRV